MANSKDRLLEFCEEMPPMPKAWKSNTSVGQRVTSNGFPLVVAIWTLNILGPFPTTPGKRKFLLVAVDYFTKWVEVEPLTNIMAYAIKKFFWKNIITCFEIPNTLVSDNGL